jgi:RNA-directed DNA polymerase
MFGNAIHENRPGRKRAGDGARSPSPSFAAERRQQRGLGKPESYAFLGFTHICARNRRCRFLVRRRSRRDRVRATLRAVKVQLPCRADQFGLAAFRHHVTVLWRRALRRRGQRDRTTWSRAAILVHRWLPRPRILHPWPSKRFAVTPEVGAGCPNGARPVLCGGR